jgi:hypothetical protein
MKRLLEHAKNRVDNSKQAGVPLNIAFLSDTIVIACKLGDENELPDVHAVMRAAIAASDIIEEALNIKPALAYRGCMSFGDFYIEEPFMLGPAIDEATTHYELADGALVWLLPSAFDLLKRNKVKIDSDCFLAEHAVPMKGGAQYHTAIVSPFDPDHPPAKREQMSEKILSTFDTPRGKADVSVRIKRQNTEAFLRTAAKQEPIGEGPRMTIVDVRPLPTVP